jgi:hypothetical protein
LAVCVCTGGCGRVELDIVPPDHSLSKWPAPHRGIRNSADVGKSSVSEGDAMPQRAWSNKRERQYEHIKQGLKKRGSSEDKAEEIAARTVNKERARSGEAKQRSSTSTKDISSSRRGGLRSHSGSGGRTKAQLYEDAKRQNIEGRSTMTKAELEKAVGRR